MVHGTLSKLEISNQMVLGGATEVKCPLVISYIANGQLEVGIFQFAILLLEGKSIKPWIFNYLHRLDGWDMEPRQNYGKKISYISK